MAYVWLSLTRSESRFIYTKVIYILMTMNDASEQTQKKCYHDQLVGLLDEYWNDESQSRAKGGFAGIETAGDIPCPDCGRTIAEINRDPKDIDPTSKVSEQPHGNNTHYCNQHGYVKPDTWQGETVCPYHQRVSYGEEGPEFYYDEFNQDGEEW